LKKQTKNGYSFMLGGSLLGLWKSLGTETGKVLSKAGIVVGSIFWVREWWTEDY